jgi:capsular polysaccharide biosynthesis protein
MKLPDLGLRQWTSELDWTPDWEIEGVHERGLGRGRVKFSGFTPKRIARNLRKFDMGRQDEPAIHTFHDAVYVRGKRCLYRLDGTRIDETMWTWVDPDLATWPTLETKAQAMAEKHMPATITVPQRLKRVEGPVLYLGELKRHYGHFLTDGMARLWALDRLPTDAPAFFHLDPVTAMGVSHVGEVMEALGVPADRMIWPDRATVFSEVICPMPAMQLSVRAYDVFDRPHRWAAEAIAGDIERPAHPVYLSRRGLGQGHRELVGEDELERRLEAEGYLIVQPERVTLAQQIALFEHDKPVIGPLGSALHTVLFRRRPRGAGLGVLTPPDVPARFLLIDRVKANRTTYCNCMAELTQADVPIDVPLQQRSWAIDVDRAMAQLDHAGFFRR